MIKEIYESLPKVKKAIERSVKRAKRGEKVLIIGVGNSCGIGDNKKSLDKVREVVMKLHKKAEEEKKNKKKGSWF